MVAEIKSKDEVSCLIAITASSFIVMCILGIFAELLVRNQLISFEDPIVTYKNIRQSLVLFNSGILAFIIIIALDAVLSIVFYRLLSPVNKTVAQLMASLRLLYVAIKGFAIVGLFLAKDIYTDPNQIHPASIETSSMQAMQYLKMHQYGFGVGLIFFGLHLLFLAFLFFKTEQTPKWIVWMLAIAGEGYIANSIVGLFTTNGHPSRTIIIGIFIIPMSFAELLLGLSLWLRRNKWAPVVRTKD